jgi:hypothetical protein
MPACYLLHNGVLFDLFSGHKYENSETSANFHLQYHAVGKKKLKLQEVDYSKPRYD